MKDLPIIDLTSTLAGEDDLDTARTLVDALHRFGAVIVRDPRVLTSGEDVQVRTMAQQYFAQPWELLASDVREELGYQVGLTPPGVEKAVECAEFLRTLNPENYPTVCPAGFADPKMRFMWRAGTQPAKTRFPKLNKREEQVVPAVFTDLWPSLMDRQAQVLINTSLTCTMLVERGLGLKAGRLTHRLIDGATILALNAIDLSTLKVGDVINACHNDFGFLTAHDRSTFPGLVIWLRDGTKLEVSIPPGCFLVQVGQQLEYVTGGYFLAGYHEVSCTQRAANSVIGAVADGRSPFRVARSLFLHLHTDAVMGVMEEAPVDHDNVSQRYPPTLAGTRSWEVLIDIGLATREVAGDELIPITDGDMTALI